MEKSIKIDWLSFTTRRKLLDVVSMFSFLTNPLELREKGLYGYACSFVSCDGVSVFFTAGRPDVHVQITGRAEIDFITLVSLVHTHDHVSRLDIALDCLRSGFSCSDIWGYLRQGKFVSGSDSVRQICSLQEGGGYTIYVGAAKSDRMLRIYDKGSESGTGVDWVRYEIQLRRGSADVAFNKIKESGLAAVYYGLLNKTLRLVQDTGSRVAKLKAEGNQKRLKLAPIWAKITNRASPLLLSVPRPEPTVASAFTYIKNSASTLRAMQVMPDFNEFITGIIDDAVLKDKHKRLQDELAFSFYSI